MSETKSNLPAESGSTELTRFNALRHGVLSRYIVLPWEDADEYAPSSRRSRPSVSPRVRPRSIWSRNWQGFYGGNAVFDLPRRRGSQAVPHGPPDDGEPQWADHRRQGERGHRDCRA